MASWLFAIGVSTLVFAALTFLLRTETSKESSPVKSKAKIFMLPVGESEAPAARGKILSWLDLNSPETFIKPDPRRGYSALCQSKPEPLQVADLPPEAPLAPEAPRRATATTLPRETPEDMVARIYGGAAEPLTAPPFAASGRAVAAASPRWVDDQGSSHGLDNGGRRAPGAATALRVDLTSPGLYPRVRVLASCGDKELDALAAKQVCQEVLKLGPDWQDAAAVGPNVRALWRD